MNTTKTINQIPHQQRRLVSVNDLNLIKKNTPISEILFITSFPPRECGIATYSQDLITALNTKFHNSFKIKVCALENDSEKHTYAPIVKFKLNIDHPNAFHKAEKKINTNTTLKIVLIQHEFGLFNNKGEEFINFLKAINKPVIIVFHTVLPHPNEDFKLSVQKIVKQVTSIIVMTHSSAEILKRDYAIDESKITIISHGTHLVEHIDKEILKHKYHIGTRKVLSTFGLLSAGKSIETTLDALRSIVQQHPDVLFLIIGKTHPSVVKREGEKYREFLQNKIESLQLQEHVQFINQFVSLPELLEYLQLTDLYLFTSNDPNQAVSGTFSYALSCGCPIISTPIPHAREVLTNSSGIIFDFGDSEQLGKAVNNLLKNDELRRDYGLNALHTMASTAWENAAIAHATLFEKISNHQITLHYTIPNINLNQIKKLTTNFGMIQFSKINQPDIESGYTLDDNARAMISICQHYELTHNSADISYITIYFNFIKYCLQSSNHFLNYVDEAKAFTPQNKETNLADANGRAIWALGYLLSIESELPENLISEAQILLQKALKNVSEIHSTRAMAFIIKGLYYRNLNHHSEEELTIIKRLANRLIQMYRHESNIQWLWFESYFTYANSIIPEALLCAWLATDEPIYKDIAKASFDFLLSKTFTKDTIKVIPNTAWLHSDKKSIPANQGGEQPIDVSYTIIALDKFSTVFPKEEYSLKMEIAFSWFLGNNHLNQITYNPSTGGCYDGLEVDYINLNQGAESTVSYLMARMIMEKKIQQDKISALSVYIGKGKKPLLLFNP